MAEPWSQSAASLESIFSILSEHDHPFVMVGKYALNWMGVPVHSGYIMDILLRTSQAGSIYQALVQSGEWLEVDKSSIPELAILPESGEHDSIGWFKRYDDQWYISLCTEDTYHIVVDTEKIQVPHPINFNSVLVESEFHPNPQDEIRDARSSLPYLITDEGVKFVWGEPITFPVFIPTIPEYLDSCLNRIREWGYTCYMARMDMDNLARYLVLDSPHQQEKVLSKVENTEQLAEYFTQRQQRQERCMKRIMEQQRKHAALYGTTGKGLNLPFIMKAF
ncbi:hypothetical protein B9Z19DRAFT_1138313 [Tuber borchii]|uniref:Uncharacterized protein n=1 Tax=Tuber borchii TaxID=42251 RepID=A0A2T6Z9U3_TUBBO|nr:hypothetical protein B9Z19DRAFT_1138313 [Tuber borchii]